MSDISKQVLCKFNPIKLDSTDHFWPFPHEGTGYIDQLFLELYAYFGASGLLSRLHCEFEQVFDMLAEIHRNIIYDGFDACSVDVTYVRIYRGISHVSHHDLRYTFGLVNRKFWDNFR